MVRRVKSTYRPPQGTNKSALNRRCAPFLNSVPSTMTSPAIRHVSAPLPPLLVPVREYSQGNLRSWSSTLTRYPSLLSFFVSKWATGTRSFASRTSSSRFKPAGSASTPLPSMIATVLSELSRISSTHVSPVSTHTQKRREEGRHALDPKSPSGPPVCTFVTSFSLNPSCLYTPTTYCLTPSDVIPYVSCGIPPRCSALLPVVNDFHHDSAPRSRACTEGFERDVNITDFCRE